VIRQIVGAGIIAAGAAPLALTAWLVQPPRVEPVEASRMVAERRSSEGGVSARRTLEAFAARRTPFRASGEPPLVPFGAIPLVEPTVQPAAPKPALVLTGIVWGSEPAAILEGVPGMETAVPVRSGERVGPLSVRHIGRDQVVVVGLDTVWVLRVREPW
jgi:hypothetical protein